jgi:glycosyltransferase involved in cell wall biosynthesis
LKPLRLNRILNLSGGGPMKGVRQITPHLAALGVTTPVASLDPPDAPWLKDQPFQAIGLGPVACGYGYRRGLPPRIRALVHQHNAVIIQGIWQYHASATWRALHGTNIPNVVYSYGLLDPWFKRAYPLKHLKKWVYWPWANFRVLRDPKAVLFSTEHERLLARQSFWLYRANEAVVGYGTSAPVDALRQRQAFLQRFPHLHGQRILMFLSRIHPKKGVVLLIEAWVGGDHRRPTPIACDHRPRPGGVGRPPCSSGPQRWASPNASPGQACSAASSIGAPSADLFCLHYNQRNFVIVVAEALACGLPVEFAEPVNISSDVAAARTGLVHADTAAGTTGALGRWLTLSDGEKQQMGVGGEELFRVRFDFASMARNLLSVLEAAIQQQPVRLTP